jgi:serine/threonine-protein kinase
MQATDAPQVIGRYAIYGKIAQGGMAAVHFGRLQGAAGFSRTVAIKRLHAHLAEEPDFKSIMVDEARLAARIHHPNVVPTLDVVAEGGELLIVMEYVRGESLYRLLRAEAARGRRVPLPIASAIMLGALHGLHAAHEATSDRGEPLGIVHRDISPHNILIGVDGAPRIIDFGVAKAAGRLQSTREGVVKGKVSYMAPEQLAAQDVTRRSDVYSMGVVFWQTLAGRSLFAAESDAALVVQVLVGASRPPSRHAPDLPAELDAVVMTSLSRAPEDRFATAREMAEKIVRIVPPALPTEVGAWVEELAHEALSRRASSLAEIESISGMAPVLPSDRSSERVALRRPSAAELARDDLSGVASQPSSLSVETGRSVLAPGQLSRRAVVAGVSAGAALLAVCLVVALLRRGAPSETASGLAAPSAQTSGVLVASEVQPSSTDAPSSARASDSSPGPAPSPPVTSAPAPWPQRPQMPQMRQMPQRPTVSPSRPPAAAPRSSGMVRFSQPD